MALKVWTPGERLLAGDLNGNFSEVASGRMPGITCAQGPQVAVTAGSTTELPPPGPIGDTSGYWNSTTKRIVVPTGLGGLYICEAAVTAVAGGAKGDIVRMSIQGIAQGAAYQMFTRHPTAIMGGIQTAVSVVGDGSVVYVQAYSETAATLVIQGIWFYRLAFVGAYAGTLLAPGLLPAPEPDEPEPKGA